MSVETGLQDFIFTSKYSRWLEKEKRRESWDETVGRVEQMHLEKFKHLPQEDLDEIRWAFDLVRAKRVLPSMRAMQFGGKAIFAHNARIYNCSVRHIDSNRALAEIAYLMLCGCGTTLGLSKRYLSRFADLVGADDKTGSVITYVVEDTIEGWADSIEALINCYTKNNAYSGRKIVFDYSRIRRKGSLLKTGGGKAPGYKPLKAAHARIKQLLDTIIEERRQTRLKSINVYDIMMHFADAVLSGGIRRTASAVVFDADDEDMINAKISFPVKRFTHVVDEELKIAHCRIWVEPCGWLNKKRYDVDLNLNDKGEKWAYENLLANNTIWWKYVEGQRARSNNSVLLLRDKLTEQEFSNIIARSKQFGEPGFVFADHPDTLFNPCYEVGFIPVTTDGRCGVQFCNLCSINGALINSVWDFEECIKAQTIIGTLQASYTHFPYLSNTAKELTEEEALLGNSITGFLESPNILLNEENLRNGAAAVVQINREWAKKLGINPAARTTLVKPEGTGSLAIGVNAPGAHAAHAEVFFKRVQVNEDDNVYQFFKLFNPHMCEKSVWSANGTDDVITFPMKAKDGAIVKEQLNAIQHLEIIKKIQQNWVLHGGTNNKKPATHNVSCTVIVKDDEWEEVIKYVHTNRGFFSAISFLGYSGDKHYPQAPFEKVVTEEDWQLYHDLRNRYEEVDFTKLSENYDETSHTAEASCAGGNCVI
jgi:ribonucleoside-triphosphate reductase (thioredoxin)